MAKATTPSPRKKTVKKAAPRKGAKTAKASTKKAPSTKKTAKRGAPSKNGELRKPQIRILQCLAKTKSGIDRKALAAKAQVDPASCTEYLGSINPEVREANDKKHFPSLLGLGYVRAEEVLDKDERKSHEYLLTSKGKQVAAKL